LVPGVLFPGVKQPGYKDDHSPPSNSEVKNAWTTLPRCLDGVVLN